MIMVDPRVTDFDDAVRRALTHLSDPTKLAGSPLLSLRLVAAGLRDQGLQDTRHQRATILRAQLIELLEGLIMRGGPRILDGRSGRGRLAIT